MKKKSKESFNSYVFISFIFYSDVITTFTTRLQTNNWLFLNRWFHWNQSCYFGCFLLFLRCFICFRMFLRHRFLISWISGKTLLIPFSNSNQVFVPQMQYWRLKMLATSYNSSRLWLSPTVITHILASANEEQRHDQTKTTRRHKTKSVNQSTIYPRSTDIYTYRKSSLNTNTRLVLLNEQMIT